MAGGGVYVRCPQHTLDGITDLKPKFERALNHISKAEFHRHRVGSLTQPSIII